MARPCGSDRDVYARKANNMKPEDLKKGDILRDPDGTLWNVDFIHNDSLVVVRRIDVHDLKGWEKVDSYHLTGKGKQP